MRASVLLLVRKGLDSIAIAPLCLSERWELAQRSWRASLWWRLLQLLARYKFPVGQYFHAVALLLWVVWKLLWGSKLDWAYFQATSGLASIFIGLPNSFTLCFADYSSAFGFFSCRWRNSIYSGDNLRAIESLGSILAGATSAVGDGRWNLLGIEGYLLHW